MLLGSALAYIFVSIYHVQTLVTNQISILFVVVLASEYGGLPVCYRSALLSVMA
jgi:hypothetical protein